MCQEVSAVAETLSRVMLRACSLWKGASNLMNSRQMKTDLCFYSEVKCFSAMMSFWTIHSIVKLLSSHIFFKTFLLPNISISTGPKNLHQSGSGKKVLCSGPPCMSSTCRESLWVLRLFPTIQRQAAHVKRWLLISRRSACEPVSMCRPCDEPATWETTEVVPAPSDFKMIHFPYCVIFESVFQLTGVCKFSRLICLFRYINWVIHEPIP